MTQSSYLMSFIHGLLENSSKEIRERKRQQLERDYVETEEVVNVCLKEKYEEVNNVLNVYREVSTSLEANKTAVRKMKRDIGECRGLLTCNREELRRLWLELIEQRRILELIDIIDRVRSAPEIMTNLISARAWPEATEFLLNTMDLMGKDVRNIPALDAVRSDLALKRKSLVEELQATLFFLVFKHPLSLCIHDRNFCFDSVPVDSDTAMLSSSICPNSSEFGIELARFPLSDWKVVSCYAPLVEPDLMKDPKTVAASLLANSGSVKDQRKSAPRVLLGYTSCKSAEGQVITDRNTWSNNIVAILHCLHRLQKLTQVFSSWRIKSQVGGSPSHAADFNLISKSRKPEVYSSSAAFHSSVGLLGEIHRNIILPAVAEIERNAALQGENSLLSTLTEPRCLSELLQIIFPALFMHFGAIMLTIRTAKHIRKENRDVTLEFLDFVDEEYVWGYIQQEVQIVLSSHLACSGSTPSNCLQTLTRTTETFDAKKLDLNQVMGKKRAHSLFSGGEIYKKIEQSLPDRLTSESKSTDGDQSQGNRLFFSFSKTSHSLSVNSYLRENRLNLPFEPYSLTDEGYSFTVEAPAKELSNHVRGGDTTAENLKSRTRVCPLVCRPAYKNITYIYSQVVYFIKLIELCPVSSGRRINSLLEPEVASKSSSKLNISSGLKGAFAALGAQKFISKDLVVQCQLRSSVQNFIEQLYLPETKIELKEKLSHALSDHEALSNIVNQATERELCLTRPILSVAFLTNQMLDEVREIVTALPEYAVSCVGIIELILETFVDWASRAYGGLTMQKNSQVSVPSVEWARDNDLSRFWTAFPVWQRMTAAENIIRMPTKTEYGFGSSSAFESHQIQSCEVCPLTSIVFGLSNLSPYRGAQQPTMKYGGSIIPFVAVASEKTEHRNGNITAQVAMVMHEREATRLAVKEMDQLLHMIQGEIGSTQNVYLPIAKLPTIKIMGRLHESACWLLHCVRNLTNWLQALPNVDISRVESISQELASFSDACLLMVYLDVRIHAFNLFGNLPRIATYWCPVDEVDVDTSVTECLVYWEHLQEILVHSFAQHKIRFIFDGLGDFVSQLFIRIIPNITRMNPNGNRKMCRNLYKLQQGLATMTENHESDLIRVKQLYELLYLTPEAVINQIMEQGAAFTAKVYQDLLNLYQRSHPSHDHARTEEIISKLADVIH